jgi:hypothetical protein
VLPNTHLILPWMIKIKIRCLECFSILWQSLTRMTSLLPEMNNQPDAMKNSKNGANRNRSLMFMLKIIAISSSLLLLKLLTLYSIWMPVLWRRQATQWEQRFEVSTFYDQEKGKMERTKQRYPLTSLTGLNHHSLLNRSENLSNLEVGQFSANFRMTHFQICENSHHDECKFVWFVFVRSDQIAKTRT